MSASPPVAAFPASSRTAPPRGFPIAEFEARLERAQRGMAEAGVDALLLTNEPEIRYFLGFMTQSWQSPTMPSFLVIPAGGKPIVVIAEISAVLMARTWSATSAPGRRWTAFFRSL